MNDKEISAERMSDGDLIWRFMNYSYDTGYYSGKSYDLEAEDTKEFKVWAEAKAWREVCGKELYSRLDHYRMLLDDAEDRKFE